MTHLDVVQQLVQQKVLGRECAPKWRSKLFDTSSIGDPQAIIDFLADILESSTEHSIIATDLTGRVLLWNEGARRLYGYEPDEVIGKMNSSDLHTLADAAAGLPQEIMRAALERGQFAGTISRRRKNGEPFAARLVLTRSQDAAGNPVGFLIISKDISDEIRMARYARSLIEASLDPLVAISADGKITDLNEATANATGVPRDQLIGTDFSNCFTEPEKAQEGYRQAIAEGMVTGYPLTIRHAGGGLTDVLYNASVNRDERGNVLGAFAATRGITEGRRAEQDFQSLIESAPDAIVVASKDGTILLTNNQTERLFGYQRDELLGKAVEILVPTRFRDAHLGHRSKFFSEPRLRPMGMGHDLWGTRKDGSEFPVEISLSPIESPHGLTIAATIRDVTVQKAASNYTRSLIEASLDPLVTISAEGKITDVNEATTKVTGIPRDQLIGTDFSDYFAEPEKAQEGYRQVFAKGMATDFPLTIRHANGRLTHVLCNASVYRDERGNVLGVFAAARDVTAQKQAEAQVADQRAKELERMAELERFQKLTMDRELRMIELKKEIENLKQKVA